MGSISPWLVWAQAAPGVGAGSASSNPLIVLVPRRWYGSLSLSSTSLAPTLFPLWLFLAGLAALFVLSMMLQGPGRAARQFVDLPSLVKRISRAIEVLRRASWLVGCVLGLTVFSWTASQAFLFRGERGREDLATLMKSRGHVELGVEQGLHGMLTAFRDLGSLGDNLPLLILAIFLMSRFASDIRDTIDSPKQRVRLTVSSPAIRVHRFALIYCALLLQVIGRTIARFSPITDLPLGGCTIIEVAVIPLIILVCDGFFLSWVLVELREAISPSSGESEFGSTLARALELTPAGMAACASILPARYLATGTLLLLLEFLSNTMIDTWFGRYVRWQLGDGLACAQGCAIILTGVLGIAAWSRGTIGDLPNGLVRLLRAEGGRVSLLLLVTGLAAGIATAIPYLIVLLLPAQTWTLAAADSYSHYATLPVALIATAALVEFGRDTLPAAHRITAVELTRHDPVEAEVINATPD